VTSIVSKGRGDQWKESRVSGVKAVIFKRGEGNEGSEKVGFFDTARERDKKKEKEEHGGKEGGRQSLKSVTMGV